TDVSLTDCHTPGTVADPRAGRADCPELVALGTPTLPAPALAPGRPQASGPGWILWVLRRMAPGTRQEVPLHRHGANGHEPIGYFRARGDRAVSCALGRRNHHDHPAGGTRRLRACQGAARG